MDNPKQRRTPAQKLEMVQMVDSLVKLKNISANQACAELNIRSSTYYEVVRMERLRKQRGLQSPEGMRDEYRKNAESE